MGYHPTTRSREYREGWKGRKRIYRCRSCGSKFQVDTLKPLPIKDRICEQCKAYLLESIEADGEARKEMIGIPCKPAPWKRIE